MRRFALIALLSALSGPAEAAKPVTVDQLERVLASTQSRSDKRAAQILSNLVLTERLSALDFNHWQPMLPGPEARRELVILADQAEFLPPPFGELPAQAPPNLNRQRQMLAATVEYAAREVRELPNFLATRETIHFEDTPQRTRDLSRDPAGTIIPYEPLHAVNQSTAHVLFRDGTEVVETAAAQDPNAAKPHGLTTWGEFGPILTTVLVDAANGNLAWRRWERSADGLVAVF
ncbi:MAG TPA: hypothetical protein VHZ28_14865, partial [Terracidiphilus sp.]|nr:hypothetical protein [Terracidiphilus sp.]